MLREGDPGSNDNNNDKQQMTMQDNDTLKQILLTHFRLKYLDFGLSNNSLALISLSQTVWHPPTDFK